MPMHLNCHFYFLTLEVGEQELNYRRGTFVCQPSFLTLPDALDRRLTTAVMPTAHCPDLYKPDERSSRRSVQTPSV